MIHSNKKSYTSPSVREVVAMQLETALLVTSKDLPIEGEEIIWDEELIGEGIYWDE